VSKRSTAILPLGEDISKVRDTFFPLEFEGRAEVGPFFLETASEVV
jgi:hypothetical protein